MNTLKLTYFIDVTAIASTNTVTLDDPCSEDEQCATLNAKCERQVCSCVFGYVAKEGICQSGYMILDNEM